MAINKNHKVFSAPDQSAEEKASKVNSIEYKQKLQRCCIWKDLFIIHALSAIFIIKNAIYHQINSSQEEAVVV